MRFRFSKQARFSSTMIASACFIALAIWGWDLPLMTALAFFLICIGFLVGIVGLAALFGWLLHCVRRKPND